jgi:hypothetical protein
MGFLKLDVRPKAHEVCPEGRYTLTCNRAKYELIDKEMPVAADNLKGFSFIFAFKSGKIDGEIFQYLNLFHSSNAARSIALQEFGEICQSMGFSFNANGEAVTANGSEVEPSDFAGKTCEAHIIVKPHYQNADQKQNVVKSWIMPKAAATEEPPLPEIDSNDVNAPYDDDVPY